MQNKKFTGLCTEEEFLQTLGINKKTLEIIKDSGVLKNRPMGFYINTDFDAAKEWLRLNYYHPERQDHSFVKRLKEKCRSAIASA